MAYCSHCGKEVPDGTSFCTACGAPIAATPKNSFCTKCGSPVSAEERFCKACGAPVSGGKPEEKTTVYQKVVDFLFDAAGQKDGGPNETPWKELVSDVFKSHTKEEKEDLLTSGMGRNTRSETEMYTKRTKPWFYSRVFLLFAVVSLLLWVQFDVFSNPNSIPGLMFVSSLIVPFSTAMFFWECNLPRDISFFDCVKMFMVGGVFSLLVTLVFYQFAEDASTSTWYGALLIGVVEEAGKLVISYYYVRKTNTRYILSGLLIGAFVGAGFAAFETAGYCFTSFCDGALDGIITAIKTSGNVESYQYFYGFSQMMDTLTGRMIFAISGHALYAAISTVGLCVVKGNEPLKLACLKNKKFWWFFGFSVVSHGVWDMYGLLVHTKAAEYIFLSVLSVVILFVGLVLVFAGRKQIRRVEEAAIRRAEETEAIPIAE